MAISYNENSIEYSNNIIIYNGEMAFTGDANLKKISVTGFAGTITLDNKQQSYGYGLAEDMEFPLEV